MMDTSARRSRTAPAQSRSKRLGVTAAFSLLYLAVALACLIQWQTPHPWARVDFFAGGYLGLRALGAIHSLWSARPAFGSESLRREWWALTTDRRLEWTVSLLMACDLTVFLDYGHWHILPVLERPVLQGAGLVIYVLAATWQSWTDVYLAKHFASQAPESTPMSRGPFRYVRHPRYAAAVAAKAALALTLASVLGWLCWVAWILLLVRQVKSEELHLKNVFGTRYQEYAEHTARLVPGIY
jgi:protein-S-isoprenylcysteine O-methyltransferase Ste14